MGEPGGPWSHGCEHYWERAAEGSKCGDCVDPTLTSSYPDTLAGVSLGRKGLVWEAPTYCWGPDETQRAARGAVGGILRPTWEGRAERWASALFPQREAWLRPPLRPRSFPGSCVWTGVSLGREQRRERTETNCGWPLWELRRRFKNLASRASGPTESWVGLGEVSRRWRVLGS